MCKDDASDDEGDGHNCDTTRIYTCHKTLRGVRGCGHWGTGRPGLSFLDKNQKVQQNVWKTPNVDPEVQNSNVHRSLKIINRRVLKWQIYVDDDGRKISWWWQYKGSNNGIITQEWDTCERSPMRRNAGVTDVHIQILQLVIVCNQ